MSQKTQDLVGILREYLSDIVSRSIITLGLEWSKVNLDKMNTGDHRRLLMELEKGVRLYVKERDKQDACLEKVSAYLNGSFQVEPSAEKRVTVEIQNESDIVNARATGRNVCRDMGFSMTDQVKVSTAISELARNIVQYAGVGRIAIEAIDKEPIRIKIVASDKGPGIAHLDAVLGGSYESKRGMGIGLKGTKNLMDEFDVQTKPGLGTIVTITKYLVR